MSQFAPNPQDEDVPTHPLSNVSAGDNPGGGAFEDEPLGDQPFGDDALEGDESQVAFSTELLPSISPEADVEIDPEDIVQEAEQLLREGAPHDFDVLVIGGGPGGYVAAIKAAQNGAQVGLIEEREIGGVCLNRGCIPTKTLLESVDVMRLIRRAHLYGVNLGGEAKPDIWAMHKRKTEVVQEMRERVAQLLKENNVEVLSGHAKFVGEHCVELSTQGGETRKISAVHIIIATGSLPQKLPIEGADLPGVVTSDDVLETGPVPESIVVVGAGAVGVEFAYLFHELGAKATLIEAAPTIMPQEDPDIAHEMERLLHSYGLNVITNAKLQSITQDEAGLQVEYSHDGETQKIAAQTVLMATGRKPNTENLNLEAAGIEHEKGKILVDENCETNVGGVYAIGDCIREAGWAHLASGEGTLVAEIVTRREPSVNLKHVPSCYYTHPEIASVGLSEPKARELEIATRVGKFPFRSNGKAAAAGEHDGFVKIVVDAQSERILGCQIIGPRATELINQAVLALKTNQTIDEMVGAIHAHPTFSEALPEAALAARRAPFIEEN